MQSHLPINVAERMRRYRARLRSGAQRMVGELTWRQVDWLIDSGYLDEQLAHDPRAVGAAVLDMLDERNPRRGFHRPEKTSA